MARRGRGAVAEAIRVKVVTVSTRAASGAYEDRSGPAAVDALRALGYEVGEPHVVPDGEQVRSALQSAVKDSYDVVVTTGGTGLSPDDQTPDITLTVIDREVPGISAAVREAGRRAGVATAALSRGVSGVAGRTLIVNLPGSTGGVVDGIAVLAPLLEHAVNQLGGGDH